MKMVIAIVALSLVATPGVAQKRKAGDPNRTICRTSDVIGSRLQTKRTCMTAAEWVRLEREQRETVEKVQSARTVTSN